MSELINSIAKRLGALPPDPYGGNGPRSDSVEDVLTYFMRAAYTDPENVLADLLCNLMHWCDRNATDFEAELFRAQSNYLTDTDPKDHP